MLFLFVQFLLYRPATGQADKAFAERIVRLHQLVLGKANATFIQPLAPSAKQRSRYAPWQHEQHKLLYRPLFSRFVLSALPFDGNNHVNIRFIRLPFITLRA